MLLISPYNYCSIFPNVGDYVFDPKNISRDPAAVVLPPKMGYFEKTEKEVRRKTMAHCSKMVAHCSKMVAHCSKMVAHCSKMVAHCSKMVAHCSKIVEVIKDEPGSPSTYRKYR